MTEKQVPIGKKFIAGALLVLADGLINGIEKSDSSYDEKKTSQAYATLLLKLAKRELK